MVEAKHYGILNGSAKVAGQVARDAVGTGVGVGVRAGVTGGLLNFTPFAAVGSIVGIGAAAIAGTALLVVGAPFLTVLAGAAAIGGLIAGGGMLVGALWGGVAGTGIGITSSVLGGVLGAGKGLYNSITGISKSNNLVKSQERETIQAIAQGQNQAREDFLAHMGGNAFTNDGAIAQPVAEEKSSAHIRTLVEKGAKNAALTNVQRVTEPAHSQAAGQGR